MNTQWSPPEGPDADPVHRPSPPSVWLSVWVYSMIGLVTVIALAAALASILSAQ